MINASVATRQVLVADDDASTRQVLQSLLTTWGFDCVTVQDGMQAFTALEGKEPPLIAIIDGGLQRLDGLEVCRRVRKLEVVPTPYLILLPEVAGGLDNLVKGLEAGADACLLKPVEPLELRARLAVACRFVDLQTQLANRIRRLEETPLVQEIVGPDHPGLQQTLRLCVTTFAETLKLPDLPRQLRLALRTCRGLCLESLNFEVPQESPDP